MPWSKGRPLEVRAVCRTRQVPYKEQMVSALLPGDSRPNEELVFTAHLFEGFAKQGANDDASGCAAILETARTLRKLLDDGRIPPLRRSIRFLFVPEISGTAAYIEKYPEVAKRFFANINEDMVGEDLIKNRSLFNLERLARLAALVSRRCPGVDRPVDGGDTEGEVGRQPDDPCRIAHRDPRPRSIMPSPALSAGATTSSSSTAACACRR